AAGARGWSADSPTEPSIVRPATPPVRRTRTNEVGSAPPSPDGAALPDGSTPTVVHARRTASAWSPADAMVAGAKPAKSVSAVTCPPVRAAYQICPAPSQVSPPIAVAAR